ncbi:MAG TPA: peptide deformylase [Phycisphaerae bacterium]|nr:peptide deformylase [Phycisphaerae bacterium]HPS53039.1 peptide deformylase [Phycisphaerae bacterium]
MTSKEKIAHAATDIDSLAVIKYPDPRLKEVCTPIEEITDDVRALAARMKVLMFSNNGVGLAASQVGVTVRLFVTSPTFNPDDFHAYVNPEIISSEKPISEEEGCLSFPGIYCKIKRPGIVTVRALSLDGEELRETHTGLAARAFQHELDHLNGVLLADRMGSLARMVHRAALSELVEEYQSADRG